MKDASVASRERSGENLDPSAPVIKEGKEQKTWTLCCVKSCNKFSDTNDLKPFLTFVWGGEEFLEYGKEGGKYRTP